MWVYLYMDFFFSGIELHDPWLTESTDAEWQAQRADYEVICRFSTARRVGPLNRLVVQGSTVYLRNGNMYPCECVGGLPPQLSGKEPACQWW